MITDNNKSCLQDKYIKYGHRLHRESLLGQKHAGMLRGLVKMDCREKMMNDTVGASVAAGEEGTALVQCVERFFKQNPQQNYEVPLQLLQEWFSDTSMNRRQELAKLLLSLLEEQGLDMEQVTAPICEPQVLANTEDTSHGKVLKEVTIEQIRLSESEDMGDSNLPESSATRWANQTLGSDPIVLKSLREFRPVAVKPKQDTFLDSVSRAMQFNKLTKDDEMVISIVNEECRNDKQGETVEVGVYANQVFEPLNASLCSSGYHRSNSNAIGRSSDFPVASKEKRTRSVGTSTFKECGLISRFSSEPSLASVVSSINSKRYWNRNLRKSASLPSVRSVDQLEMSLPPLTPIVAPRQTTLSRVRCNGVNTERVKPVEVKLTLITSCSPATNTPLAKPKTTFVEMSHAEFIKRQMLLNERVSVRHGVRMGGQIVCVPELVSCSAPHTPSLLLHSTGDLKTTRTSVEMKIPAESVVVSQSTSSHTIHYTPSPNRIASNPTIAADKCSVLYVRESLTPVPSSPTWQEQARKKPIIAYAKRKPSEASEIILTENMKVLISPNRVLNQVEPSKALAPMNAAECELIQSPSSGKDVLFVKRGAEDKGSSAVALPPETSKPTLPKFNQTFVQNFQLKPVHTELESVQATEVSPLDLNEKPSNKLNATFNRVPHIAAETTIVTDEQVVTENSRCGGNTGVIHSSFTVPPSPVIVDRPALVKPVNSSPAPPQVGLLIYTQGSSEESAAVPTLLLTTLPNGSAYCVRLPTNTAITSASSIPPQIDPNRPLVVQASLATPVTVKPSLKKPDALDIAPPVESNKVALLKDLKEFENVFEETKLKFEKEKQLNVAEAECAISKGQISPPQPLALPLGPAPKLDCEKVVVGVKRKPECELPVLTRLYTTAKKPVIVVANYGQSTTAPPSRPIIAQTCTAVGHMQNKTSKGKSRSGKTYPNPSKSPPATKPQQKPQEDEKTQQKIFAILEEYAVQKEHSPDTNNRPAPRRRSNPPSASASKKKRPIVKGSKDSGGEAEDGNFSEI